MIDLSNVSWKYPHAEHHTLTSVDLHINAGECVVVCGASGSGKSTLLRLINGLVPHFYDEGDLRGRVIVEGVVTSQADLETIGRRTGTVQQHPRRQFFTNTVSEELAFAMENFALPVPQIAEQVGTDLQFLGQNMDVSVPLTSLSGGQQQQVALASSTAHRPRILLLDEPSSNLSTEAIAALRATLERHRAAGMTIVIAEHRLSYLNGLVDRVVIMDSGEISAIWDAERFAATDDAELESLGLRGEVCAAQLATRPAVGPSIVDASEVCDVPEGALELRNIECRAGRRTIVAIDRLTLPRATVTALRGSNGAGKSTLARVIAGLRRARGEIRLDGRKLSRGARQRASALVMQDVQRQLFTDTVEAEIELAGRDAAGTVVVADLLQAFDLSKLTGRHPLSLSGGEQQRLVIAGSRLAGRPIVIFDEPSSGVDRRHLESIAAHIRSVAADGAVVILISHDEDLLARAADQQITLRPLHQGGQPAGERASTAVSSGAHVAL
ncbi:ATP-binding cassette domain-containing protein [Dermatophilus congolensis]|uniref:ATP-binding cassette domain-containing protein n=1 Tax=Dermatophilus congolensis TaxID=1863 RepID=UPI001AB005C4|nr:ABC transporter ATP-binding protein [Dermatophilus congolensis]MBO3151728.1 ABC transporter ATP-binding protein [Dermatophilus congolensis]MBO3161271.1 ABC transporter ATP-binding protein [Dermatophilus congolensis]MBO3163010.1 ABC transporter ATP-binding protein [Dermatophilus congolensis]MBO3176562.1 ABC transporter ATP-binding protein [Dermatophilus congolensis]